MRATKRLHASFFMNERGRRPVREWLMDLPAEDRRTIGEDIATLEFLWPVGMPKCKSIIGTKGLYELRSNISAGRIARVFFVTSEGRLVLLHGFVKKSRATPAKEMELAKTRMKDLKSHEH